VGRTGAGKSSLFQALFRLVSLESGIITVDGIDISTKSLRRLRRSMSIIPQDPFLFSGSLRENLDPYGLKSDEELWDSLRKAHMADAVGRMDGGLDSSVEERGRSFSVGQRQLGRHSP
jgi:ABC-type multidrug transport system fused ATPase/permease subunit